MNTDTPSLVKSFNSQMCSPLSHPSSWLIQLPFFADGRTIQQETHEVPFLWVQSFSPQYLLAEQDQYTKSSEPYLNTEEGTF